MVKSMNPLYEKIEALCRERGINVTQMCREAKVSRGSLTDLKMGRKQNLSLPTLCRLAAYFQVSMDDFSQQKMVPLDDFTYALYQEASALTPENQQKLLELARFFQEQQRKEEGNP